MKFTYEDLELRAEVDQVLTEFGPDLEVIAIYSTFLEAPNVDFVTYYLWCEPKQEDFESEAEYESDMDDYLKSLKTSKERKYKRMKLYELSKIIQKQAEIF